MGSHFEIIKQMRRTAQAVRDERLAQLKKEFNK